MYYIFISKDLSIRASIECYSQAPITPNFPSGPNQWKQLSWARIKSCPLYRACTLIHMSPISCLLPSCPPSENSSLHLPSFLRSFLPSFKCMAHCVALRPPPFFRNTRATCERIRIHPTSSVSHSSRPLSRSSTSSKVGWNWSHPDRPLSLLYHNIPSQYYLPFGPNISNDYVKN